MYYPTLHPYEFVLPLRIFPEALWLLDRLAIQPCPRRSTPNILYRPPAVELTHDALSVAACRPPTSEHKISDRW
ncbi:hypothetical protein PAXRUDRAFT_516113 [Paxillus rubicundulus Ve08.2h10]|uniref:Uncharacterized protein n=1 Tax=Paxillus rubicundulus Ve08.2h10 TaxID=930991 RepID=A0A0D0D8X9_9AGAM|nr:hypothetical protein PAXRUDRAFT_516113 [Paxillus rubicundulus Ve08.2h10]